MKKNNIEYPLYSDDYRCFSPQAQQCREQYLQSLASKIKVANQELCQVVPVQSYKELKLVEFGISHKTWVGITSEITFAFLQWLNNEDQPHVDTVMPVWLLISLIAPHPRVDRYKLETYLISGKLAPIAHNAAIALNINHTIALEALGNNYSQRGE